MFEHASKGGYQVIFIALIAIAAISAVTAVGYIVQASEEKRMFEGVADIISAVNTVCAGGVYDEALVFVPKGKVLAVLDCATVQDGIGNPPGFDTGNQNYKDALKGMQQECNLGRRGFVVARAWKETKESWGGLQKEDKYYFAGDIHPCEKDLIAGLIISGGDIKLVAQKYGEKVLVTYAG